MSNGSVGAPDPEGTEREVESTLDPRIQESIGRSLKAHYDDLVNAPIPDKFLALLTQLEAQERRAAGGAGNE